MSATLNHLPFYTLQKPCKFPAAATDAAFDGALRDAQHLGDLFVIHVFEVPKNNSFAELRRELFEGSLDAGLEFEPGDMMLLRGPWIGQPIGHRGAVLFAVEGGVEGVAGPVKTGAAEVVDEEVSGQGGDPGLEAALLGVEAGEIFVELEEDVLGEVFCVGGGAGKTVADSVNTPVLGDDELLPGLRVTSHALAYQLGDGFLCCFLFWGALQLCLWRILLWEQCIACRWQRRRALLPDLLMRTGAGKRTRGRFSAGSYARYRDRHV